MKEREVARQITPSQKIFTFSRDEVKKIMLKAANEPALTGEEMYHRVELSVDDSSGYPGEWQLTLSVKETIEK